MCTRLIAPAPVACAMWMQSSIVASPGGRSVPGSAVASPSTNVTRTPRSSTRARSPAATPPLRSNSLVVSVTQSNPASDAAAASSGNVDRRKV